MKIGDLVKYDNLNDPNVGFLGIVVYIAAVIHSQDKSPPKALAMVYHNNTKRYGQYCSVHIDSLEVVSTN